MPIYEYQCRECSHRLEKLQKISDPPLSDCPECGEPALTKLISAAGFRLKGGGWYETDFKDKGKRNIAGDGPSDSGGKSEKSDKSTSKSDGGSGKSESKSEGSKKTDSASSAA
ncbi:MAG: FmdB family zinc ribbon protein [Candidatus Wenzhouxiangella sp. M2_3B_020]